MRKSAFFFTSFCWNSRTFPAVASHKHFSLLGYSGVSSAYQSSRRWAWSSALWLSSLNPHNRGMVWFFLSVLRNKASESYKRTFWKLKSKFDTNTAVVCNYMVCLCHMVHLICSSLKVLILQMLLWIWSNSY